MAAAVGPEQVGTTYRHLADVLINLKKYDQSLENYNKAYDLLSTVLAKDCEQLLTLQQNKAIVLMKTGKCEEAKQVYEYVMEKKI